MKILPTVPASCKHLALSSLIAVALAAAIAANLPARAGAPEDAPQADLPKAFVDGNGPGWRELTLDDFVNVNCDPDTWRWEDNMFKCTGNPVGVIRTPEFVTNLELVVEWRHLKSAGNSGVFFWVTEESVTDLPKGKLPHGIEVQVLDHGYTEAYEQSGKKADWFTSNGDVFPVGVSDMTPFPPVAPDGKRSFPVQKTRLPRASASGTTTTSGRSTAKSGSG